jgi:hypothetical protein
VNNKLKYFEIIKIVNAIFRDKQIIDYTKISPEDLIARFDQEVYFYNVFDETRLDKVRNVIREYQSYIYKRTSNIEGIISDNGFDQLNYAIQNSISRMKNVALRELADGGASFPLVSAGEWYNPEIYGRLEDLEEHITKENIAKYVENTLTITCSNIERINNSLLDPASLIRDIFFQFGIKPDYKSTLPTAFKKAEELVREAIYDSTRGSGSIFPGNSDNDYQPVYEHYYTDRLFFNTKMEKAIKAVTELVSSIALPALELTKAREEAKENSKKTIETIEPEFIDDDDDKSTSEERKDTLGKYQQIQEYLNENIELVKGLAEIDNEIAEVRTKLNELLAKREEIRKSLSDNDNKIRRGL